MAEPQPPDLWEAHRRPTVRRVLVDLVLAAALTALALVPASRLGGLSVAATLAMGAALVVRRVSWPVMTALGAVSGVLQLVDSELAVVADLGYFPIFFALGSHPSPVVRRLGLGGALASAVVLATGVGVGGMGDAVQANSVAFAVVASAALALLVAGGGWASGYVRWQNRARITAQVQAGLDQERTRIAADMHDLVAHTWAVVAAQADGARYALGGAEGDRKAAEALDVIADTARGSIADLRDLLAQLRYQEPAAPPGRGARDAVVDRVRASGMELRLVEHGEPSSSGLLAVVGRRLLAESLTNALKHGDLRHPVDVEEDWRHGYRLVVRNRVRGSSGPAPGTGHGLAGMRDRVVAAGGSFAAGAEGDTWTTRVELPEPAP